MDFLRKYYKNITFGSSQKFKKHAVLYDVFGNFYLDFEEGPGYAYASPLWLPHCLRDEILVGQISGLHFCSKTDFPYEWLSTLLSFFMKWYFSSKGIILKMKFTIKAKKRGRIQRICSKKLILVQFVKLSLT